MVHFSDSYYVKVWLTLLTLKIGNCEGTESEIPKANSKFQWHSADVRKQCHITKSCTNILHLTYFLKLKTVSKLRI